jgi:hypothetical protein
MPYRILDLRDFRSAEPVLFAVANDRSGLEAAFGLLPADHEKQLRKLWVAGGFPVIELSSCVFEVLKRDEEFILYRGKGKDGASQILVLSPAGQCPSPEVLKRLENEYSFTGQLNPAWAAQPIEIATHWDRTVLVLQDPGGVPLNHLLRPTDDASAETDAGAQPLDIALALRLAISHESGYVPIDQVQKFLGHLQLSTTQIYAQTSVRALGENYVRAFSGPEH